MEDTLNAKAMSQASSTLFDLLVFFDADRILVWLLTKPESTVDEPLIRFLYQEDEFEQAISELAAAHLIKLLPSPKAISVDRTAQRAKLAQLSGPKRLSFFNTSLNILSHAFPNTWDQPQPSSEQGHGWMYWDKCAAVLPHVRHLVKLTHDGEVINPDQMLCANLLFRMASYLWEIEQPTQAKALLDLRLGLDLESAGARGVRYQAQAYRLLGHISLDSAQPRAALSAYRKSLGILRDLEDTDTPPIADAHDSIACCYAETGEIDNALKYLSDATAIRRAHGDNMARTQAIYAMTYLRANNPEHALKALNECWALQGLTQEEVVASAYPKHSGDLMLLARIKEAQGDLQTARDLISHSVEMRRKVYGESSPRVADSMFFLARIIGNGEAASSLKDIINMSEGMPEMKAHLARALWLLAELEDQNGNTEEASNYRKKARKERDGIEGQEARNENTSDAFIDLVPWILW